MLKRIILLVCFGLALFTIGCNTQKPYVLNDNGKTWLYINNQFGFQFEVSKAWMIEPNKGDFTVLVSPNNGDAFQFGVQILDIPDKYKKFNFEQTIHADKIIFLQALADAYLKRMPAGSKIADLKMGQISGKQAGIVKFEFPASMTQRMENTIYILLHKNKMINLTQFETFNIRPKVKLTGNAYSDNFALANEMVDAIQAVDLNKGTMIRSFKLTN